MDSNNFDDRSGVGEREARIVSSLVSRRNYYLAHGIGRSGDIMAHQPKAAGSSLIHLLARHFTTHALQLSGLHVKQSVLLPMATGMSNVSAITTEARTTFGALCDLE